MSIFGAMNVLIKKVGAINAGWNALLLERG